MSGPVEAPVRVRLSRQRGWRMPPFTVKVDRSSPFGNPYHGGREAGGESGVDLEMLAKLFRNYLHREGEGAALLERARRELRGWNLACWCPLGGACHADILLDLVNGP